jgi:hypothetical protein
VIPKKINDNASRTRIREVRAEGLSFAKQNLPLAATAFSLAETALLLSSLQERMYERTVAEPRLCGSFVEGDATPNDQKVGRR